MADEDSASRFRVVDRRSFDADGSRKPDASPEEKPVERAPERERSEPRAPQRQERPPATDDSRFEMLVSYLSTTAMFQLGLIPGPSGEPIPMDLPNARRTIELLEGLQEKTKGNLTGSESQLLDDALYELRMSFVEMQKRQARKSK